MSLSPQMFRQYDIRGVYGENLTDEKAKVIGRGAGTFFLKHGVNKLTVAHDNRLSSLPLTKSLITGLKNTGCQVIYLGLSLTPIVYFSWYHLAVDGSIMITASHNPPEYNGFKISLNKSPLLSESYQEILKICRSGLFAKGSGSQSEYNIWPSYQKRVCEGISLPKKLKIVFDFGNGTAGLFVPEIMKKLGCKIFSLFEESDGRFPNHVPYPQKTEFYQLLKNKIVEEKADIGFSYDGDGDRLGVYDEKGNFVENDRLAMILINSLGKKFPHPKIVMNVATSLSFIDYTKACGGEVVLWKTGYPNILHKMGQIRAVFGGEISGHFFFKDRYFGFDDAVYASLRLLEIVSREKKSLSALVSCLPKYFETREIRIEIPEGKNKFAITDKIAKEIKIEYPKARIIDFDGVRFEFSDGWGLVRPSNTEEVIGVRAEAKSKERLGDIQNIISSKLNKNGLTINWS